MNRPRFAWVALVLVGSVVALAPGPGSKPKAKPGPKPGDLPPLNRKVAEFARDHVGEAVGDGICITLATDALRAAGAKVFPLDDPAGDYRWGEPVGSLAEALPGDILQFRDAVFQGKTTVGRVRKYWDLRYAHHTAVVARVEEKGKVVTIWHQNVATRGADPSERHKVQETTLRVDWLKPGGAIHVFRPVSPGVEASDPPKLPVTTKP